MPRRPMLLRFGAAAALALTLIGCASYTDETKDIRAAYRADDYHSALEKLEKSSLKDQSRNRLLYRLEKAMILDRLGEGQKARALLVEADGISDELYTTSVSKTALSFVYNDSATDYAGEDYERVAIHTQLALSFLGDKDLANARVEARKINNKLQEINQQYENNKDKYTEDAFARYLSAVIYEARGEFDDAIIDYQKAIDLYAGTYKQLQFATGGVPDDLVRAEYRLLIQRNRNDRARQLEEKYPKPVSLAKTDLAQADYGELVVVHEMGHIATKTAENFVFPFGKQVIRFSFPVIKKSHHDYMGQTGVTEQGGTNHYEGADNVQDMDAIAKSCLEDRRVRMIVKESARLLAKGQLTEQAYKNFGIVGGIAANIYSAVSETADTRSWTLLPEAYFITRVRLAPGKHIVRPQTGGRTGKIETVELKKGQVQIIRDAD